MQQHWTKNKHLVLLDWFKLSIWQSFNNPFKKCIRTTIVINNSLDLLPIPVFWFATFTKKFLWPSISSSADEYIYVGVIRNKILNCWCGYSTCSEFSFPRKTKPEKMFEKKVKSQQTLDSDSYKQSTTGAVPPFAIVNSVTMYFVNSRLFWWIASTLIFFAYFVIWSLFSEICLRNGSGIP